MNQNTHIADFLSAAERRFNVADTSLAYSEWLDVNKVTLKGKPFSLKNYLFQTSILDDLHPNMSVIKCSQVGLTTIMIYKTLVFIKRNRGVTAMFTMPNEDLYAKFSSSRMRPVLDENGQVFYSEEIAKPVKNSSLIQLDLSFLHITGSTEADATSTDADALFHDEIDLMNLEMLALFDSRLQNSLFKIKQRFSTPTHVGYGIDAEYNVSDQREYVCKCDSCGHWNIPDFTPENVHIANLPSRIEKLHDISDEDIDLIDFNSSYVKCERCHRPLDLNTPHREWVAKYPSRSLFRGYRVRPFSTDRLPITYITTKLVEFKRRGALRRWYNTVLGKAFTESDAKLSREEVLACFQGGTAEPPALSKDEPVFIGFDVGIKCHIIVWSRRLGIVRFEVVKSDELEERIEALKKIYRVVGGAGDRHPYTPTLNSIRERSNGAIMPVEYRGAKELSLVKDELKRVTHVQAERTAFIDATIKMIRNRQVTFSGYGDQQEVIIKQLTDMVRDEPPGEPARWLKITGDDHYHHAFGFALFAERIKNAIDAENKSEEEERTAVLYGACDWQTGPSGLLLPNNSIYPRVEGIF